MWDYRGGIDDGEIRHVDLVLLGAENTMIINCYHTVAVIGMTTEVCDLASVHLVNHVCRQLEGQLPLRDTSNYEMKLNMCGQRAS